MARGGGAFSDEEIQLLRGLPAVANVTRNRITYADSFKQVCTIRYLTGESPTKIFREAGLPPDLIGYKRIERCVDRWKTSAIKSVTGSGNMSDSEIIAQLVNRYEHAFVMRRNLDSITNRTMEHIPSKRKATTASTWEPRAIIIKQQARRIDELERQVDMLEALLHGRRRKEQAANTLPEEQTGTAADKSPDADGQQQ